MHERELQRGNRNRATLAVARKLVAYLMAVDKSGKPFQVRRSRSFKHLIHPEHNKVILWDNNILGEPNWREVIEELKELKLAVDFNQGLDARFLTEEIAECFRGLNMPFIRLAYDFPSDLIEAARAQIARGN